MDLATRCPVSCQTDTSLEAGRLDCIYYITLLRCIYWQSSDPSKYVRLREHLTTKAEVPARLDLSLNRHRAWMQGKWTSSLQGL